MCLSGLIFSSQTVTLPPINLLFGQFLCRREHLFDVTRHPDIAPDIRYTAVLIDQSALTVAGLCELLAEFYNARDRLLSMAKAARRLGVPDATRQVSDCCLELAHA